MAKTKPAAPPDHVDDTVQAILGLHAEHQRRASRMELLFGRATAIMAAPGFLIGLCIAVTLWIVWNLAAAALGARAFDPVPFDLLQGLATLGALVATLLILATQRRDDQIALEREHVALQLAMLNDRKLAKLIELIEEQRRDHPALRNRVDAEAEALAAPVDPRHVLNALRDS